MTEEVARRAAEAAARASYGRLLALLAARTRDIAAAEDALAEAFAAALVAWPRNGVPANPDAWLMTVARNRLLNEHRHGRVRDAASAELLRRQEQAGDRDDALPDERLGLLFACAHPAIDAAIRTPLMLQAVLGLDAARIAGAFLVPPATMGQRLVRAKARIRDAGIRFVVPGPEVMPERLAHVLDAVYAAYGVAWDTVGAAGPEPGRGGLAEEAIFLGRLLVALLPGAPEAKGLLALMLYCEARRAARRGPDGAFVPLAAQDPRLWDAAMIREAEALLVEASRAGVFGRFLCEAAVQSVHVGRAVRGFTDHAALRVLYDLLVAHVPTLGARVARAAALLEAGDVAAASDALDEAAGLAGGPGAVATYQPYWATRARVLARLGDEPGGKAALATAIGLTSDDAVRRFLQRCVR
ncbi:RNA polymerase sigma factor [Falsiroseomonas sp. HW251]|uniref:RNA polymerase sigma factor n=1 Tax=Falsiroseomonas sp. HW251 TaxID=3390998 RepID=UPI003D30F734